MIVLDTCICIDFLRGRMPQLVENIMRHDPSEIKIPAVVQAELNLGVQKSNRRKEHAEKLDLFLSPFDILPFDSRCSEAYGRVRSRLERKGSLIGPNDLLIAATALANEATLVTTNIGEFKRVEGLMLESWNVVDY